MIRALLVLMAVLCSSGVQATDGRSCPAALDFYTRPLLGEQEQHLCELWRGRVVLIVNTASKCAFTPQYEGLEQLYAQYRERGLLVSGFPSNDFGAQEPGTEQQIRDFCRLTYSVEFPMFAKTRVIGPDADPLYRHLVAVTGDTPRWNFHKYLLDREGRVVASFPSHVRPNDPQLIQAIEALL